MSQAEVFHLGLREKDLRGATVAIVPGDPDRVPRIAGLMNNPTALAHKREFNSWLGEKDGKPIVVCSTGIGGPSVSIAVEELAQLGVRTFLRVGTTGAIQPHINVGDILITTGSVRLDGASLHFAPLCYPAVSDFECLSTLVDCAKAAKAKFHVGITAASDTFYPGQERLDTYSGKLLRSLRGSMDEWRDLHVMNFEMESATLFTMCSALGLRAGMLAGAIVNRTQREIPDESSARITEKTAVAIVVEAAGRLA